MADQFAQDLNMVPDSRAEFEAWASYFFTKGELDRHGINGAAR